jgi:release factor glutamine methyltransferase
MDETNFRGLSLLTLPGQVMVPRSATEQLVREAISRLGDRPAVVADVGTGSGAIAVALAQAAPQVHVWATDTSRAAVELARANVRRYGLSARVDVVEGDLLDPVPGELDLIVANLPYLPRAERSRYGNLAGEPQGALFAAGDGLGPYRRLLDVSRSRLRAGGTLLIQLHRRVVVVERDAMAALREQLPELAAA